jgi:membrane fusion protein (multidrug efflux system)
VALVCGLLIYVTGGRWVAVSDAYVENAKVGVSTDVSGIVREVDVTENQSVKKGQVLFRLDDLPFRLALRRAEAEVGMAEESLNALRANYRDLEDQIVQGRNDVKYYSVEFARQQDLLTAHVASQASADLARRNLQAAQQKLGSLGEQVAAVAANLGGDPLGPNDANPKVLEAVAARDEAARELAHTTVTAPFAGVVTDVPSLQPGKYLAAAATAFYLVASDGAWVDADPKETQLAHVRPGQPAVVTVDAYPDLEWRGTVASISPAAAQEFALLPAQNSSGNWVKVVQRVPLRIHVDAADRSLPPLRAGMSVVVKVDTGRARGWPHLLKGGSAQRTDQGR